MTKYTPGPWFWTRQYRDSRHEETWSLVSENGYGILSCDGLPNSPQELGERGKSDARLIAAAPDLLEALERITRELGVPQLGYPQPVANAVGIARTAIAKARGE